MNPKKNILFLTVFLDLVGFGMVIPLIPYLSNHMQATPFQVGVLVAVYSGMQFILSPVWGAVSDRIGRRPILLASLFMASVAHLIFAFSSQLWMLFVARSVAGLCAANISTAFAYMADITTAHARSKAMGFIGAAFGLGFVVGPALGGLGSLWGKALGSTPPFGPQFAALLAGGLCFLNFVLAFKILHESHPQPITVFKYFTNIKIALKAWLKTHPASNTPTQNVKHKSTSLCRIKNLFKIQRTTSFLLGAFFLYALAMALMELCLFLFLDHRFSWSLTQMSFAFAYVGLIMALVQGGLVRPVLRRWGEPWVLLSGVVIFAIALLCFVVARGVEVLAVAGTLVALGHGLAHTAFTGCFSLLSQQHKQGFHLGVQHSVSALTRVLGPLLGGWVYAYHQAWPFAMGSVFCLVSAGVVVALFSKLPNKRVTS